MSARPLSNAAAAISADPAGQLLQVTPRTIIDAWRSLEWMAGLGVVTWLLLIVAALWALNAARQQLTNRHALALALWTGLLGSWVFRTARHAGVLSDDELVDYAQAALGVFTAARPVELIFPTGWTQLVTLLMAPIVYLRLPDAAAATAVHSAAASPSAAPLAAALLDGGPMGLLIGRWLGSACLVALAVGVGRAITLRTGAAAGIFAIGALLTSAYLQPLAAQASPHVPALALAWAAVLLLASGETAKRHQAGFAGLLMGYAMGSHGLAVLVSVAALPLWWRHRRALHLAILGTAAGVLVSNPHLWDQWPAYLANLRFRLAEIGAAEAVADAPNADYGAMLLTTPMLLVGLAMWAVALPMERRLRSWDRLGPAATGVVLLALLFTMQTRFDRYFAWALPGLIWAASLGFGGVIRRLRSTKLDALAAGTFAVICLAWYAIPVAQAPCPNGIDEERPLAEIAVRRSGAPIVFITQVPQLRRAVVAGLLPPEFEAEVLSAVSQRVGGRARIELRAYHDGRALPGSFARVLPGHSELPGAVTATERAEVWDLRCQRALPRSAPLHVSGRAPLQTHQRVARCGMLLRAARLPPGESPAAAATKPAEKPAATESPRRR